MNFLSGQDDFFQNGNQPISLRHLSQPYNKIVYNYFTICMQNFPYIFCQYKISLNCRYAIKQYFIMNLKITSKSNNINAETAQFYAKK